MSRCNQLVIAAALLLLASCTHIHLHNEEDAKIAAQAKENYAKIEPIGFFAAARTNLQKISNAEIAQTRESLTYLRDLTIYDLAMAQVDAEAAPVDANQTQKSKATVEGREFLVRATSLESTAECQQHESGTQGGCYVQRRMAAIGPKDRASLLEILRKFETGPLGASWEKEVVSALHELTNWNVPTCEKLPTEIPGDILKPLNGEEQDAANGRLRALRNRCSSDDAFLGDLAKRFELGEFGKVAKRIISTKKALATITEQKKRIIADAAAMEKEIEQASKAAGQTAEDRKKGLVEKARELRKVFEQTDNAAAKIGVLQGVAHVQLERLDILLAAVEGEEIPEAKFNGDANFKKAALVAQSIPGLAAEMGETLDRFRVPPKASILIAKGQALVDKQDAENREAILTQRLALYRVQLRSLIAEATLLKQASDLAVQHRDCYKAAKPACDGFSLRAYSALSQSFLPARLSSETAKYYDLHLDAETIVQANEYALRSWDNMVRVPLEVLAAYHEGGIKPAEVADLVLKAGGLGALAIIAGKVD